MELDGPINGRSFQTYLDRVLIPDPHSSDIVILNNLGSRKGAAVQAALRSRRRALAPFLQPGFQSNRAVFSKLEAHLRKAAERTRDALWDRTSTLTNQVSPEKAQTSLQLRDVSQIERKTL